VNYKIELLFEISRTTSNTFTLNLCGSSWLSYISQHNKDVVDLLAFSNNSRAVIEINASSLVVFDYVGVGKTLGMSNIEF
jgi:hypothetical protein